jgi:tetratricopeptide (TPR) repeat protein
VKLAPEISAWTSPGGAAAEQKIADMKPATFQDITPGETTRDEVLERLGAPATAVQEETGELLTYAIGPFPKVCITVREDVVASIVIHLAGPSARDDVAKELGLENYRSAIVRDDQQQPLGEVYPERGLMFAYAQDGLGSAAQVDHVVLETLSAEPFLLRCEQTPAEHVTRRLADLRAVQHFAPQQATAWDDAAQLELASGRPQAALVAAQRAVELDGASAAYAITLAEAQHHSGKSAEALQTLRSGLERPGLSPLDQLRGKLLLGRLLAVTTPRDFRRAMEETVAAIKLASAQARQAEEQDYAAFQERLIDAELSLAAILAYGPWKQKHEVVPQWLATAEKAANEYVQQHGGSRRLHLSVYRTSLQCLMCLEGQGAPDHIVTTAADIGRELVAAVDDDDYRAAIEWQLGTALWYAAQIAHQQGRPSDALRYATNADVLLVSASKTRSEAPETAHHLGQLQFLAGSIQALQLKDNAAATHWYDKALPHLQTLDPGSLVDERATVGEQLVSVGITLWETGRRNTALSVTEEGTALLLQAVSDGLVPKAAVSIPYQNLAVMHRQLGNTEQADRLAGKATEADPQGKQGTKLR